MINYKIYLDDKNTIGLTKSDLKIDDIIHYIRNKNVTILKEKGIISLIINWDKVCFIEIKEKEE